MLVNILRPAHNKDLKMYSLLKITLPVCLLVLTGCGQTTSNTDNSGENQPTEASETTSTETSNSDTSSDDPFAVRADNLIDRVAKSVCSALTRCCDTQSQVSYFAPVAEAEFLEPYRSRFPTNEPLDYPACINLMLDILPEIYLGSWLSRVDAGEVTFNAEAAQTCLQELDDATCGLSMRNALYDNTCFGLAAPYGDEEVRKVFNRTGEENASCAAIRDGFGGLYYGSCNPQTSFCCIPSESFEGSCSPYPSLTETGVCMRASQEGESCNEMPLQLCKTGLYCDVDTATCKRDEWPSLAIGETCMEDFDFLGECENSFCNFQTEVCEPLKNESESCMYGSECATGWCDQATQACTANPICEE